MFFVFFIAHLKGLMETLLLLTSYLTSYSEVKRWHRYSLETLSPDSVSEQGPLITRLAEQKVYMHRDGSLDSHQDYWCPVDVLFTFTACSG